MRATLQKLVICMHWIERDDSMLGIYGLMPVAQTNADTIVVCIKDILLHMNFRIQDARGQCYDGCSTMTGNKNGVAAKIMKLNKNCQLTHCYCHSLELAVSNALLLPLT